MGDGRSLIFVMPSVVFPDLLLLLNEMFLTSRRGLDLLLSQNIFV